MMPEPTTQAGDMPVLHWLLQKFPTTPKTRAKQWIVAGRVSVAGVVLRKPHQLIPDPGDTLQLLDRYDTSLNCGAGWQIHARVTLLYLDSAVAIVNKGPGLISVPAPDKEVLSALGILADFLAGKLKTKALGRSGKSLPIAYRRLQPLPVHRLDQYTSGVFCIAMNPAARAKLIEQLRAHTMHRQYVAFAEGRAPAPKGTWRHWLQLTADEMRQQIVPEPKVQTDPPEAKEAITHYEVLAEYPVPGARGCVTKLQLRLETGRKHQIRVQAANAGLPLIGDRAYNPRYRQIHPP